MKKIKLTQGKYALVDNEDYEYLIQWKWCYCRHTGYAFRGKLVDGKINRITMHRQVNRTPKHLWTDHINRNKLDNRKCNLRSVTPKQNRQNSIPQKPRSRFGSAYKGIRWIPKDKAWQTRITVKGKQVFIGQFKEERHAAMAYDIWARDTQGKFAVTNF